MATFRDRVPSIRDALTPGVVRDLRDARQRDLDLPQWRAAQSARLDLLPSLAGLGHALVVDLGANVGDWTAALLRVAPTAQVIAVEPAPGPRAELHERFGADTRVQIEARAVAGTSGTAELHLTEHSHNASLHAPHDMDHLYGHGWRETDIVTVETTTVDELVGGRDLALLKIDVQGAELDVLRGAAATLAHTAAVLLEVTFVSHYDGDASFAQLHEHMTGAGFALAGLSAPFMSHEHTVLWCDACYTPLGPGPAPGR